MVHHQPSLLLPLALVGAMAPVAADADRVGDILLRYARAEQGVNLVGNQHVLKMTPMGPRTSERHVVRTASGTTVLTTIAPSTERGMLVWDDGNWAWKYTPQTHEYQRRRSMHSGERPTDADRTVRLIRRNYHVELGSTEPWAGRICDRVRLVPNYRLGRTVELWIDRASGASLYRSESDPAGNTVALYFFTSVTFPTTISPASLKPAVGRIAHSVHTSLSPVFRSIAAFRQATQQVVRLPVRMPAGYEFESATRVQMSGRETISIRYNDGLAAASIFFAPAASRRPPGMVSGHIRPRPMGENELAYATTDSDVLVVGCLGDDELIAIARSMSPGSEETWTQRLAAAYSVPSAAVVALRNQGLAIDAIAAVLEIAGRARRDSRSVAALVSAGYSWRDVAKRYGVPAKQVEARFHALGLG